ncbi:DUF5133 domain-containing protein [Streptomyces lasalocidi]
MADPSLLKELVERCDSLKRRLAADGSSAEAARNLEDATYTLCVVTGTRQLDAALFVARRAAGRLPGPTPASSPRGLKRLALSARRGHARRREVQGVRGH